MKKMFYRMMIGFIPALLLLNLLVMPMILQRGINEDDVVRLLISSVIGVIGCGLFAYILNRMIDK